MNGEAPNPNEALLDALLQEFRQRHGDDLVAVVLYGSSAVEGLADDYSDLNVLALFRSMPVQRVRGHVPAMAEWEEAGNAPPQLMTLAEWRSAADVFPMEYADILESHRVLYGSLPPGVEGVAQQQLRMELERDALGGLIQLRRGLLGAGGDRDDEVQLLTHALGTFMAIGRALARLHGEVPPHDHAAVARRTGELAGFEPEAFLRVLDHRSGRRPIEDEDLDDVVAGYVAGVTRLARHVNSLDWPEGS